MEHRYFPHPTFDIAYLEAQQNESPSLSSSTLPDLTIVGEDTSSGRHGTSTGLSPRSTKTEKGFSRLSQPSAGMKGGPGVMADIDVNGNALAAETSVVISRPKRVRTGCLTCRERHLKCDEAMPHCQNCRKSNRTCKRGVRLNFIDTQVQSPPIIPSTHDWQVNFQDESREIASEYKGGLGRYAVLEQEDVNEIKPESNFDYSTSMIGAPTMAHQTLPPIHLPTTYPDLSQASIADHTRETHHQHSHSTSDSTYSNQTIPPPPQSSYSNPEQTLTPPNERVDFLTSPEEVLFMQVFVEEVGLWMDSMDPMKHVKTLQMEWWAQLLIDTVLPSLALPLPRRTNAPKRLSSLRRTTSNPCEPCVPRG